jgi:hypothetical protein
MDSLYLQANGLKKEKAADLPAGACRRFPSTPTELLLREVETIPAELLFRVAELLQ